MQVFDHYGIYYFKFGTKGTGKGQFGGTTGVGPWSVAVDAYRGQLFVSDPGQNKISRWSLKGTWQASWGSAGSTAGAFNNPFGITVEIPTGNVYVADTNNNRIQVKPADVHVFHVQGTSWSCT